MKLQSNNPWRCLDVCEKHNFFGVFCLQFLFSGETKIMWWQNNTFKINIYYELQALKKANMLIFQSHWKHLQSLFIFILPLFKQARWLRTNSYLQPRPGNVLPSRHWQMRRRFAEWLVTIFVFFVAHIWWHPDAASKILVTNDGKTARKQKNVALN